jgi:lipopolysaccharide/colanic/teichoic acid biosynthesis glycosyltransferase
LPITAYIAIRVKLTDGASPFFSQTRVGQDGKTFECYKLRTMYVNDYVPKDGEDIKYAESVKGDDRIIPFCRFVRKARFDEIPQMINILKGEMSIVGPRAEWANEAAVFEKEIPFYRMRNLIRAGWTGWSHISMGPCFSVDDERERLAYDLYYIKHRNVFWDIAILVKAVFLACGGRHK